jgi:hypothetical protein
MPDSGFVGLEFRGGRWQGGMQVRSDEGGSKWVALLSHPDPAMAAAARDVAVYWKTRVRGERGPRQSPAQLEARCEPPRGHPNASPRLCFQCQPARLCVWLGQLQGRSAVGGPRPYLGSAHECCAAAGTSRTRS